MANRGAKSGSETGDVEPQVQMLLLALTNVVEEMVQAKCGELSKRDRATLQRRILKSIRAFVARCRGMGK